MLASYFVPGNLSAICFAACVVIFRPKMKTKTKKTREDLYIRRATKTLNESVSFVFPVVCAFVDLNLEDKNMCCLSADRRRSFIPKLTTDIRHSSVPVTLGSPVAQ